MLVPPRIILAAIASYQFVIENSTIELDCEVVADPKPTFIWFKNGIEVNTTYISTSSHSSQMILRDISIDDAGNYTCFSRNVVGNVSTQSTNIIVYSEFININANQK